MRLGLGELQNHLRILTMLRPFRQEHGVEGIHMHFDVGSDADRERIARRMMVDGIVVGQGAHACGRIM